MATVVTLALAVVLAVILAVVFAVVVLAIIAVLVLVVAVIVVLVPVGVLALVVVLTVVVTLAFVIGVVFAVVVLAVVVFAVVVFATARVVVLRGRRSRRTRDQPGRRYNKASHQQQEGGHQGHHPRPLTSPICIRTAASNDVPHELSFQLRSRPVGAPASCWKPQ